MVEYDAHTDPDVSGTAKAGDFKFDVSIDNDE